jgi:hypothetical protein
MISRRNLEIGRKKARKRLVSRYWGLKQDIIKKYNLEPNDRLIGMYNKTTKTCSCSMCCSTRNNPWLKEHDRLSMREKRFRDYFNSEIMSYINREGNYD